MQRTLPPHRYALIASRLGQHLFNRWLVTDEKVIQWRTDITNRPRLPIWARHVVSRELKGPALCWYRWDSPHNYNISFSQIFFSIKKIRCANIDSLKSALTNILDDCRVNPDLRKNISPIIRNESMTLANLKVTVKSTNSDIHNVAS